MGDMQPFVHPNQRFACNISAGKVTIHSDVRGTSKLHDNFALAVFVTPADDRAAIFQRKVVRGAGGDGGAVPKGGGRYLVGKPYTVAGRTYTPKEVSANTSQTGKASWYGSAFHGRRTSNGEVYDMRSVTAAHPTWPLPSYVRVTNLANGRSMIVRLMP